MRPPPNLASFRTSIPFAHSYSSLAIALNVMDGAYITGAGCNSMDCRPGHNPISGPAERKSTR